MTQIEQTMSRTESERKILADAHIGHTYYQSAEHWMVPFWGPGSRFSPLFDRLDLTKTVEFACGHGRHSAHALDRFGEITLVDVNETNIEACRSRFKGKKNVHFLTNNGKDLAGLDSDCYTAIFSYDAMVHFEAEDVIGYLHEFRRILMPGGRCLLHFSSFDSAPGSSFQSHAHWRNFFSLNMMRHFSDRAGFDLISEDSFDWPPTNEGPAVDGLVLLEKR